MISRIMKHIYLIFIFGCLWMTKSLTAQNVNIFVHSSFAGFPDVAAINTTYSNVGFSSVNITTNTVDNSLTTANYQVAYITEFYNYSTASTVFLSSAQRQIVEDFVRDGGHVVWIAESIDNYISSSVVPPVNANAITTINAIYGNSLGYGPYFNNGGMGSPNMPRIHPSAGPGALSQQSSVLSSGSYATLLNVPAESKVYTSDFFDNSNFFDACTHTTLALFPARPVATAGSIIISTELGLPFHGTSTGAFGGPPIVYNTTLDNSIAELHLNLLTNVSMAGINSWANTSSNVNPNCPPSTLLYLNTLHSFDAALFSKQVVELNWTVEQGHKIKTFVVERSTNGVDWLPIAMQAATEAQSYKIVDRDVGVEILYYRLKLVCKEDKVFYSAIRSVRTEAADIPTLQIYPNPTEHLLTVENFVLEPTKWHLTNIMGEEMPFYFVQKGQHRVVLDIAHLAKGIYLLKTGTIIKRIYKN